MADDADDFLNPDEIDELLNAAKETPADEPDLFDAPSTGDAKKPSVPKTSEPVFQQLDEDPDPITDAADVDSEAVEADPGKTVEQAQAHLKQALAGSVRMSDPVAKFGSPAAYALESFEKSPFSARAKQPLEILQDVELDLRIELGRTEMLIEEVVELKEGSVVTLDKLAGDPVDILVNGRLIARGEVLVLNDNFCVRVGEILTPEV